MGAGVAISKGQLMSRMPLGPKIEHEGDISDVPMLCMHPEEAPRDLWTDIWCFHNHLSTNGQPPALELGD